MQTYTHLAMGAALGFGIFPNQPLIQAAIVAGSVAPDLSMVPAFLWDKLNGRQPLAVQTKLTMFLKNVGHHFAIWSGLVIAYYVLPSYSTIVVAAFGAGGLIHILIDMVSHNDPRFADTEARYFWPLQTVFVGTWDYRYDHGVLWPPKWLEIIVLAVSFLSIIFSLW